MENLCFVQNDAGDSIAEIVSARTGMPQDVLLNDTQVYYINNMSAAADLFWKHYTKGSKIRFFTDYDADGICSASIAEMLARALNAKDVTITVPRRFTDGYGIKASNVSNMKSGLLVTIDNGIKAIDAIQAAKDNGVDVIILDHHQPEKNKKEEIMLPPADVIVDPHVTGGDYEHYCGAGLAYLFGKMILQTKPHGIDKRIVNYVITCMLSFAAIATVADAVPLTWDNRKIVQDGIACMQKGFCTTGTKLLLEAFNLYNYISAIDLGFKIGPAVNAYGRLEDKGARKTKEILSYSGRINGDAKKNAGILKYQNDERKQVSRLSYERALDIVKSTGQEDNSFIVVYDSQCKSGIAGIVAGRLTETYNVPSIVLVDTDDRTLIKGSGRSPEGINLEQILKQSEQYIFKYGGHPGACGLTIYKETLQDFTSHLNKITPKLPSCDDGILYYDLVINQEDAELTLDELDKWGPFGQSNPEIIFLVEDIEIIPGENGYTSYMGDIAQHVKLKSKHMEITWFDGASEYRKLGEPHKFTAIGNLSRHVWNGNSIPQFQVIAMNPSEANITKNISFENRLKALIR